MCLVLDSGYSFTHVVPIFNGKVLKKGVKRYDQYVALVFDDSTVPSVWFLKHQVTVCHPISRHWYIYQYYFGFLIDKSINQS